ncbi:MAG TPA: serine hydrolase domain-containing protein, partial [Pyrinomonadaceae bacterium]|nr:serine hydrolase domain-containing protein [Pyrinomonadaceae bacterium]
MKLSPRVGRVRIHFFVGVYLVAVAAFLSPPVACARGVGERVDLYVAGRMAERQIPGLAVAVVKDGRVLKLKGYGAASVEFDVAADEHTVFQMFSVSKVFAGLAVMKLVEDGRLSLDAPVADFFEDAPAAWGALRVRHLLTHMSGLQSWSANPRFAALPDEKRNDLTKAEAAALVAELPLRAAPGERWAYHLSGYVMLGVIVERLSGKPYADFLAERVFAPLGMSATRFGGTGVFVKRRAPVAYN